MTPVTAMDSAGACLEQLFAGSRKKPKWVASAAAKFRIRIPDVSGSERGTYVDNPHA